MEITNEIRAKLFAQYIGQNVVIPKDYKFDGYRTDAEQCELVGVYDQSIKLLGISCFYPVQDFKLILKPQSTSMAFNEEDYKSMKKIESIMEELLKDAVGKDDFVGKMMVSAFLSYQYSISKGYDLPQYLLDGKTLHEAGLAIYEN